MCATTDRIERSPKLMAWLVEMNATLKAILKALEESKEDDRGTAGAPHVRRA